MEKADKQLDELPKDNTTEILEVGPAVTCLKGEHEFKFITGSEVMCRKCPTGYLVGPGTEIKKGHLFIHGTKLL